MKQNSEEELMDFLFKLNEQLNETEKELEKALKDKQANIPASTAEVITSTTTKGQPIELSQVNTSNLSTEYLIESMEELKLEVTELQKTKVHFITLEQKYDLSKISVAEKIREVNRLENWLKHWRRISHWRGL